MAHTFSRHVRLLATAFALASAGGGGSDGSTTDEGGGEDLPDEVALDTCDALGTTCDASLVGTWTYADGCLDYDVEADLRTVCADVRVTGTATDVQGTLVMGDGLWVNRSGWTLDVALFVPEACATLAGGCTLLGAGFSLLGADTARCVPSAVEGACDCDVTYTGVDETLGPWDEVSDTRVSVLGVQVDVCATETALDLQPASPSALAPLGFDLPRASEDCALEVPGMA